MTRTIIVTDPHQDWFQLPEARIVTAREYVTGALTGDHDSVRVLNLCRTGRYQGRGYYVSLLAEARGHAPAPDVKTIQNLGSGDFARALEAENETLIREALEPESSPRFQLDIYLGQSPTYPALAAAIFARVPAPLLRVLFTKQDGRWRLEALQALGLTDVPLQDRAFLVDAVKSWIGESSPDTPRLARGGQPRLAILHDPDEPLKPSNDEALGRFVKAAAQVGLQAELIRPEALERLPEFDALFNRADPEGVIREFLRRAEALGMPVIDEPGSVLKCGNKVFMQELLNRHRIPTPRSLIVHRGNVGEVIPALGLPCVLKLPDSAFGLDVVKIKDEQSLGKEAERFFRSSELLIAQEWLPTDFDWRIGVFDRRPLYASKYFMAPGYWKISRHVDGEAEPEEGDHETLSIGQVPQNVIQTAVRAANLLGSGLYGVDLKQVEDRAVLIEVNVNPNIDAGVEDMVLGDALYREIMGVFARRIAENRGRAALRAA